MKRHYVIAVLASVLVFGCAGSTSLHAQIKKQVFVGTSLGTPWANGSKSISATGGFAVVVPLSKRVVFKPLIAAGSTTSVKSGRTCSSAVAAGTFGYKVTKRFTAVIGGGVTMQFPTHAPSVALPTAIVATVTSLSKHFSLLTPVTFHKRGRGVGVQLAYTW